MTMEEHLNNIRVKEAQSRGSVVSFILNKPDAATLIDFLSNTPADFIAYVFEPLSTPDNEIRRLDAKKRLDYIAFNYPALRASAAVAMAAAKIEPSQESTTALQMAKLVQLRQLELDHYAKMNQIVATAIQQTQIVADKQYTNEENREKAVIDQEQKRLQALQVEHKKSEDDRLETERLRRVALENERQKMDALRVEAEAAAQKAKLQQEQDEKDAELAATSSSIIPQAPPLDISHVYLQEPSTGHVVGVVRIPTGEVARTSGPVVVPKTSTLPSGRVLPIASIDLKQQRDALNKAPVLTASQTRQALTTPYDCNSNSSFFWDPSRNVCVERNASNQLQAQIIAGRELKKKPATVVAAAPPAKKQDAAIQAILARRQAVNPNDEDWD